MSIIKTVKSNVFGTANIEIYNSAQELADDLETRAITDSNFHKDPYKGREDFVGATKEQTYEMLRSGYQPTVDAVKGAIRVNATRKRYQSFTDVVGFQPIVPNAIMGLPNAMINSRMTPIKTKVLDIYYDMGVHCAVKASDLIEAGQKMLSIIAELEARGYRFNLYVVQDYTDSRSADILCVKVKSANQPFDIKRMSFPVSHSAFFRGIGFDWYAKFPLGKYRLGYGQGCTAHHSEAEIREDFRKMFGQSAMFFSAQTMVDKKNEATEYMRGVLLNDKMD